LTRLLSEVRFSIAGFFKQSASPSLSFHKLCIQNSLFTGICQRIHIKIYFHTSLLTDTDRTHRSGQGKLVFLSGRQTLPTDLRVRVERRVCSLLNSLMRWRRLSNSWDSSSSNAALTDAEPLPPDGTLLLTAGKLLLTAGKLLLLLPG
jgi:hypothetical protein